MSSIAIDLSLFSVAEATAPGFDGNFAALFPGAYLVLQTDRGLTYGGTPRATGTTPPVGTLSGSLATVPVPIWFACTTPGPIGGGAVFAAFADGLGVTPFMTGITPAAGVPVPLTGPCAGLSMAWAAGTAAADNIWKATCAGLADQSGNAKHAIQPAASSQPIVTAGLNGKPGLLFDGVDDCLLSTAGSLITALPYQCVIACRVLLPGTANQALVGTNGLSGTIFVAAANTVRQYNGVNGGPNAALPSSAPTRFSASWTGTTADTIRAGSASGTGQNSGSNLPGAGSAQIEIARWSAIGAIGSIEMWNVIHTPPASLVGYDAALNSPSGYGPGAFAV